MTFTPGQYGHLAEHDALRLAIDTADATTAARVTDTGTATGAALAANFAKVVTPEAFGAVGDGIADDTSALQDAIDSVGSGHVVISLAAARTYAIPGGISITGTTWAHLTIEGNGATLYAPGTGDVPALEIKNPAGESAGSMVAVLRSLNIRNLNVVGGPAIDSATVANRPGVVVKWTQFCDLHNVVISGFRRNGLRLVDAWDMTLDTVHVFRCGDGTSDVNAYYAVSYQSDLDNTNAIHATGLHIEQSPLMLQVLGNCRHNQWVACKFEQGSAVTNATTFSPLYIEGLESSFVSPHIVVNSAQSVPILKVPEVDTTTTPTARLSLKRHVSVLGGMFSTPQAIGAYWADVAHTALVGCVFQKCYGDATTACIQLRNGAGVSDSRLTFASGHSGAFRLTSPDTWVRNIQMWVADSGNAGAVVVVGAGATDAIVERVAIRGAVAATLAGTLASNSVMFTPLAVRALTATSSISAFNARGLSLTSASPVTVTAITNGYYGQVLHVFNHNSGGGSSITFDASATISTPSSVVLAPGQGATLLNSAGVWSFV